MKKYLFILILPLLFYCSDDQDDPNLNSSVFHGLWSGIFEGDDNGTWTFSVYESGDINGTLTSKDDNIIYTLDGTVNNTGIVEADIILNSIVGSISGNLNDSLSYGAYQNGNKHGVFSGRSSTDEESQILNTWHFYSAYLHGTEITNYYDNEIFCQDLFMQFNDDGTFIDDFDVNDCEEPQYYGTFSVQDGYYELLYVIGGTQDMSDSDIFIEFPDENTIMYDYNLTTWTYKIDLEQ
jgi:hypothetical protein